VVTVTSTLKSGGDIQTYAYALPVVKPSLIPTRENHSSFLDAPPDCWVKGYCFLHPGCVISVMPILYGLHWLSVHQRIKYKLAVTDYKSLHGLDILGGRLFSSLNHCWQPIPAVCWYQVMVSTKNEDHAPGDEEFHTHRSSHLDLPDLLTTLRSATLSPSMLNIWSPTCSADW